MLGRLGKKGRVAATVLSVALSATLVSPASADVPDGTQAFFSNGETSMIFGSGSDTTYTMHQTFSTIFNRAHGCLLQTTASADQLFDMECNPAINALGGSKAPGYANYDRDLVSDYYFIGSTGGKNHVKNWNQGVAGSTQADYFRSSSSGAISGSNDGRSISFARDGLAAFTFDTVQLDVNTNVITPGDSVTELTQQQVKDIWKGNTKCWASIDLTLSNLPTVADGSNSAYVTGGKFDESLWLTAAAASTGAGYKDSDAY